MIRLPSRSGALALMLVAGFGLASASAQTAEATLDNPSRASSDPAATAGMVHTDAKGRHLAPHDMFYIVSYVSAKTDKGVEGFEPGQEVHLVEVHRDTHTLLVSDGEREVEVSPSKLTNDMDIAALVRQKDQTKQAQIAAHIQAEEEAYRKYERETADATAKDLEHRQQAQVAEVRAEAQQTQASQGTAQQPVDAVNNGNGYYGNGGYGYGNPYSYFSGGTVEVGRRGNRAGAAASRGAAAGERAGGASRTNGANPATVGTATSATAGAPAAPATSGGAPPAATGTAGSATAGAGKRP